jgi:hypothetical protein
LKRQNGGFHQVAALVGVAAFLRAQLEAHVALQLVVALSLVARAYTKGRLKEEMVEAERSGKPAQPSDDFADEEVREKST